MSTKQGGGVSPVRLEKEFKSVERIFKRYFFSSYKRHIRKNIQYRTVNCPRNNSSLFTLFPTATIYLYFNLHTFSICDVKIRDTVYGLCSVLNKTFQKNVYEFFYTFQTITIGMAVFRHKPLINPDNMPLKF